MEQSVVSSDLELAMEARCPVFVSGPIHIHHTCVGAESMIDVIREEGTPTGPITCGRCSRPAAVFKMWDVTD